MIWNGQRRKLSSHLLKSIWLGHISPAKEEDKLQKLKTRAGLQNTMKHSICKFSFQTIIRLHKSKSYIRPWISWYQLILIFYFDSIIGSEESVVFYELHICVKDSCFGRDDKLIGVSVMQLKDIQNQGKLLNRIYH